MEIKEIQPYIEKRLVNEQVHKDFPYLHIYNYTNLCQIEGAWNFVTLQCRGLIINSENGDVLARPFPKFFNYEEKQHVIPDEEPHIYEKYDGSLGILYWVNDTPYISTRGSFHSDQAEWATQWFRKNIPKSEYSKFDKNKTYLFEIVYDDNRIVVKYDFNGLVFLAVRDTETGTEHWQDDLPACIRMPKKYLPMDFEQLKKLEKENAEGFVVCYPNSGYRIKLKFEEYKRLHRIVTNVTPLSIWDALRHGSDLSEILERVPDEFYQWVKEWKLKLLEQYEVKEKLAREKYESIKDMQVRKDQAMAIKDFENKNVVFAMLDNKSYSDIIWRELKPVKDTTFKEF